MIAKSEDILKPKRDIWNVQLHRSGGQLFFGTDFNWSIWNMLLITDP